MGARTFVGNSTATYRSSRGLRTRFDTTGGQHGFPRVFADTASRYLSEVLPQVRDELAQTQLRAAAIPSAQLREVALQALAKRGNIEGAALFATLAPPATRRVSVSALVAFQTAYNYLDSLSELPCASPVENAKQLHEALPSALEVNPAQVDFYAYNADGDDGGYLLEVLGDCRNALTALPSFSTMAAVIRAAAERIVGFQSLNLAETAGGHEGLERWASELVPAGSGLRWWETAAGAGSSLAVHALVATAAQPGLDDIDARAIDAAYFPSAGALHSLLDSLVDRREDERGGRRCLLDYYDSVDDSAIGLGRLACDAQAAVAHLPDGHTHRVIVTAMCSYYLSAPESRTPEARAIRAAVADPLGMPLNVATTMFRAKRALHKVKRLDYA